MPLPRLNLRSSSHRDSLSPSPTKSTASASETIVAEPSPITPANKKIKDDEAFVEELKDPEQVPGWPELTQLIAKHPDLEAFPPYRDLHIKSLLYYQAELDSLRSRLQDIEMFDYRQGQFKQAKNIAKNVDELLDTKDNEQEPGAHYQLDLVNDVRRVLKEYSMLHIYQLHRSMNLLLLQVKLYCCTSRLMRFLRPTKSTSTVSVFG
jgi:hypothetical protein